MFMALKNRLTVKYNGKEFDRTHGLDWYDYCARQLDPTTGLFTSMDPLCEKYYNISPYSYCAGNPIRYVDPDGRDIYTFSTYGQLTNVENTTEKDAIVIRNQDKLRKENDYNDEWNLDLPYGTINVENSKDNGAYVVLAINGDEYGDKVFDLLGLATCSEWSQAKTSTDANGINILTCGYSTDSEPGMTDYFHNFDTKYIRELNHSHPNEHTSPSGIKDKIDVNGNIIPAGQWGDIAFGIYALTKHPEIKSMNILIPGSGKIQYLDDVLKFK